MVQRGSFRKLTMTHQTNVMAHLAGTHVSDDVDYRNMCDWMRYRSNGAGWPELIINDMWAHSERCKWIFEENHNPYQLYQ